MKHNSTNNTSTTSYQNIGYWNRNAVQKILHKCGLGNKYEIKCCLFPNNAGLPKERVADDYTYKLVRIDYAGSFFVKSKVTKMATCSRHGLHESLVRKLVQIM